MQRMAIIYFMLLLDNGSEALGSKDHNNGFGWHRKFTRVNSVHLEQFFIVIAITLLCHGNQSTLNPHTYSLLKPQSPSPPRGLHGFLMMRVGFSCQWEHGADTARAEACLPSNLCSLRRKPHNFCLPQTAAIVQKPLFASYHRDNSALCALDFDKCSVSQNDTMVLPKQFQLVNFDLIVNDAHTLRIQHNFLTFSKNTMIFKFVNIFS